MNEMEAALERIKERVGSYHSICLEGTPLSSPRAGIRHRQVKIKACFSIGDNVFAALLFLQPKGIFQNRWKLAEFACSDPMPCQGKDLFPALGLEREFAEASRVPSSWWRWTFPLDGSYLWIRTEAISKKWVLDLRDYPPPGLREFTPKFRLKIYEMSGYDDLDYCLFPGFGRRVLIDPNWLTWNSGAIPALTQSIYAERERPGGQIDPAKLLVLSDALEDAGCSDASILDHLRNCRPHVACCGVIDALLGKH